MLKRPFKLISEYKPRGDQPKAIDKLVSAVKRGEKYVTLLGVTGSGKTYTVANVIEAIQKPTLVIAHNKTLAAQLCAEFREFFPENAVEYFVSYYDYYQPEAYIPKTDTYIEKDADINQEIDRLRHAATNAVLTRRDVVIVASVSCIYGLGSPVDYERISLKLVPGRDYPRQALIRKLVEMNYSRNDVALERGRFRVRGEVVEIHSADRDAVTRLEFIGETLERIYWVDLVRGTEEGIDDEQVIFPATHYVLVPDKMDFALRSIEEELKERLESFKEEGKLLEYQRLKERVTYDLEMLRNAGYCTGIENYSRHLSGRRRGEPPETLIDFFPDDFLMVVDESHQTIPQLHGMFNGDRSRKETLVEFGFRLPSALDNRPLRFEEWEKYIRQVLFVSATPGPFELEHSVTRVEQIIRPTGLVDPEIVIRATKNQIDDLISRVAERVKAGERSLIVTLTKRMAEDLAKYLDDLGYKVHYLHSDVDTLDRIRILKDLRLGTYDLIVGINLLREGLDLPEVSLIVILDADKEGFLRSSTSLIQIIGRAARNLNGQVVLYADKMTDSIKRAVDETNRRRQIQLDFNREHNITPKTIVKAIHDITEELDQANIKILKNARNVLQDAARKLSINDILVQIEELETQMRKYAEVLEFEKAAELRDRIKELNSLLRQKMGRGRAESVGERIK